MSSISFSAHGRCARATYCEPITTGSVGLSVSFAFDAAWSGLQKTAIFRGSGMAVDLVLSGDAATVPPEVLTIPGGDLRVGVWGADPDGNVIIPTVWATVGEIVPGAAPSGFDPDPPTPSWAAQVQEIAQDALDTANSVREDADAGAFDGATYTPAVSAGGDLSWTNDKDKPNPPTVNIKGPEGQPGQTGATPDISIGTVETLPPGSPATATITGTAENPVLSFGIPQGQQGAPGEVTQAEFDALADEVSRQKSAIEDLEALTNRKAGALIDTASGAIASFVPDSTIDNLLGVSVDIEPVQDLHGYDSPWPAGGGANIFDAQAWAALGVNRNFYTVASDETITVNSNDVSGIANRLFDVDPGATYAFLSTFSQACKIFSSGSETISQTASGTFTAPNDGKIAVKFYASAYPASGKFILVRGSTVPSAWSPYENICPISGWDSVEIPVTGVNVWNEEWERGGINDNTGEPNVSVDSQFRSKNYIPCKGGASYFGYYNGSSSGGLYIYAYDRNKQFVGRVSSGRNDVANKVVTVPGNAAFLMFKCQPGEPIASNDKTVCINYPAAEHAYHPYSGNRYTIQLGQTVYGAKLDVDAGTLTVDKFLYVYDGTEPFSKSSTALNGFYNNLRGTTPHNWPRMKNYGAFPVISDEKSSMMIPTISPPLYRNNYGYVFLDIGHNFCVPPSEFGTTVESFKAKLASLYAAGTPMSVFCSIETPITITLDPVTISTISGQTNNVWADTGGVDVTFAADLKTYIDQKIAAAVAALS